MFDKGSNMAHKRFLENFAHMWRLYMDAGDDILWHNRWTDKTQWLVPFGPSHLKSGSFGMDVFVELYLENQIL